VRWIVDAMNVIGSRPDGWWKDRHGARARLVEQLDRWAQEAGDQVDVVFEGPTTAPMHSSAVRVQHAPRTAANSADDEIVRLVSADEHRAGITVVTSDATLAERVESMGVSVCPAMRFRDVIDPR
jgi:predicted RNA-binding protein with PIN domain